MCKDFVVYYRSVLEDEHIFYADCGHFCDHNSAKRIRYRRIYAHNVKLDRPVGQTLYLHPKVLRPS